MRYLILVISLVLSIQGAYADSLKDCRELAESNGFNPSNAVLIAIVRAARTWRIDPKELTAIGILETGLGKAALKRLNKNGTEDLGVFQINSINSPSCAEYNLENVEGNALCAAKLLHSIKKNHRDYLGRYHSKTPKRKNAYQNAVLHVLGAQALNSD